MCTKPWEKPLLSNVEPRDKKMMTLKPHMALGNKIYLFMDGGDTDGNGYFGWVIATDAQTLWHGSRLSQDP
jgi:hypothetical protein